MVSLSRKKFWAITTIALGMLPPNVAVAVQLAGSHNTTTLDCAGGPARIVGSENKVTLNGGCSSLSIHGSRNSVTAAFSAGAVISFDGSRNEVIWTTADGKKPTVLVPDFGNKLIPGK